MHLKKTHLVIILLPIILALTSCRKNDNFLPEITISAPETNLSISAVDTILVSATIIDDEEIVSVTVAITDANSIPVTPTYTFNPNSKKYFLNTEFVINEIHLESGTYYFQVCSSDEEGTSKKFVKIFISEIPVELSEVLIASEESENTLIKKVSGSTFAEVLTFNENFNDFATYSYAGQVALLGKQGTLIAFNFSTSELSWQKNGLNDYLTDYTGRIGCFSNLIYAGYRNGYIAGINETGTEVKSSTISGTGFQPKLLYSHEDYIVAEEIPAGPVQNRIELLYKSTGGSMQYHNIDMEIEDFTSFDDNRIIIWGNKDGVCKVCTLNISLQHVDEAEGFPAEKINSAIKTGDKIHLFATNSKIYSYDTYYLSVSDYLSSTGADILKYEPLQNRLYLVSGNILKIYNYTTKELIGTISNSSAILDLEFLYNK